MKMCTLILFAALCLASACSCPGQLQTTMDQTQLENPYYPSTRTRQQVHYGPVFVHNYHRHLPLHTSYHYRSSSEPGINQPYSGEYMTHLLLANQIQGPSNDNMAQLLYDNSVQPQGITSRNSGQYVYDFDGPSKPRQMIARNMVPQSYMYPGLYTRNANNLEVYGDDYVVVPAVTCMH